jgi:lactate permease
VSLLQGDGTPPPLPGGPSSEPAETTDVDPVDPPNAVNDLPVDLFHWGAALTPLVILLVLLAGLRWKAPEAGPIGMFIAAAIAFVIFQAPLETLAVAAGKGVWDAIFVLFVVWPALLLYRVADAAGAFEALREGIQKFTENELFLVLAFGWVFASFLQGIAGFGVPIAVVAPLLLGLGVKPVYAVAIPLIGHAWANMFGTLAVGWLATLQVIDLEDQTATAFQTGILLWIPNITAGLAIAWLYGRMQGLRHGLLMVGIITVIHGGVQLGLTLVTPVLSTFIASTIALVALYPLSRWGPYSKPDDHIQERPAMKGPEHHEMSDAKPVMGLGMALLPYIVLSVATIAVLVPPPVEEFFEQFEFGPAFPAVDTGLGLEVEEEDPYSPFAPLTHPGTFLLIASAVAWVVYRSRGFYRKWDERAETQGIISGTIENAVPASLAVSAFLVMSQLMSDSGQTNVLALGIEEVAPPLVFAAVSNLIGIVGAFMTSSNTASNILFAPLQQEAAQALEGIQEPAIIAAQSTGGAIGNAIAPANVVLGTGTAGIVGKEGDILRITLPWVAGVAILVGAATVVLSIVDLGG